MNAVRVRLRKLWSNKYLDRYYFPVMWTGGKKSQPEKGRALYSLAKRGAETLADHFGYEPGEIPCTPQDNAVGFAYLKHNLITTDLLISLETACRKRDDVELVKTERETGLRQAVGIARASGEYKGACAVSDGAFTLKYRGSEKPWTFHLEVVRAGVKNGNKTLLKKMNQYVRLHREGYFKSMFCHETVRAILIATTSEERAVNFQKMASQLPQGKGLFWFGVYKKQATEGVPLTVFTPETIFDKIWKGVNGEQYSLIPRMNKEVS